MIKNAFTLGVLAVAATLTMTACSSGGTDVSDLPSYKSAEAVQAAIVSAGIPCIRGGATGKMCYFSEGDSDGAPSVYITIGGSTWESQRLAYCTFVEFANGFINGDSGAMDAAIPWEDIAAATGGRFVENPNYRYCGTD